MGGDISDCIRLLLEKGAVTSGAFLRTDPEWHKKSGTAAAYAELTRHAAETGVSAKEAIRRHSHGFEGCERCGSESKFISLRAGFAKACAKCAESDRVAKIKATKLSKYGRLMATPEGMAASKAKRIQKFGSYASALAKSVASRNMKATRAKFKEHTGVDNSSQLGWVQEKKRANALKKYGVLFQQKHLTPESVEKLRDHAYLASKSSMDIALETGISQSHLSKILASHDLSPERSSFERSFHDWLDEIGVPFEKNLRKRFEMREMDVTVEGSRLCVELNGLFYHSDLVKEHRGDAKSLPPNYHLDKTVAANRAGFDLIHVWEDDWRDRREIVQSMVRSRLGLCTRIGARATEAAEIAPREANAFFAKNHLQGSNSRIAAAWALKRGGEILSCAGVGASRFAKGRTELIRFGSRLDTSVAGGFSKLLSNVGHDLVSYCRIDNSTGRGYVAAGWKETARTRPGYWYTDFHDRYNRLKYQKHKISAPGDPRPEWMIAKEDLGLSRIWDCGQMVMERASA